MGRDQPNHAPARFRDDLPASGAVGDGNRRADPGRHYLFACGSQVLGDLGVRAVQRLENGHQYLRELPEVAFLPVTPAPRQ